MIYIKVSENDVVIAAEAHENPVYVRHQPNGVNVRCHEVKAEGILSVDGSEIYQIVGKPAMEGATKMAEVITTDEYLNLVVELENNIPDNDDEEDINPEVPDGGTEEQILTRAELTAKVAELEEQLVATKILLGVE